MGHRTTISFRNENSYTVTTERYGIVVTGSVPIDELVALLKLWKKQGKTIIDTCITGLLKATAVVCSPSDSAKWRASIDEARGPAPTDINERVEWYLRGWDRGISSCTILSVLAGNNYPLEGEPGIPMDNADYGRCFRLLEIFPEWAGRLSEVAERYPEWKLVLVGWEEARARYCKG